MSTIKMTARQYLQLGEDPPGVRLELVDGEIEVSPSPTPEHSSVVINLSALLNAHIRKHHLGKLLLDVDIELDNHLVRRPDLLFFKTERTHLVTRERLRGVPDLVIEVVSVGSQQIDYQTKFLEYAKAGIEYYWIVDPLHKRVQVHQLVDSCYALTSTGQGSEQLKMLPFAELEIKLADVWD